MHRNSGTGHLMKDAGTIRVDRHLHNYALKSVLSSICLGPIEGDGVEIHRGTLMKDYMRKKRGPVHIT
jgi:hypothetical protein